MKNIDAALHTRGESQYVSDLPKPAGLLYAAVFASPVAHGEIVNIDLKKARQHSGVIAIFTARDIPGENQIGPLIPDEPLLADSMVHYIGQPVAIVVAVSPEAARKAVKNIQMEVKELEVIVDPRAAFQKGEIIGSPRTFELGDVDSTWDVCDVIVEGKCEVGGQEHVYLETQAVRAIPTEAGTMTLYSSTQSPHAVQRTVAKILGIPSHRITVDVKRLGGGFGGKEDQATPWACLAALAAWHLQKPVELVLNRHEDILMTGKRHPYSSDFKIGLKKDGTILAYEVRHYQNAGASADLSPAILERTLFHSTNAYFIPNARIFAVSCRTNLPPFTAFRGFGGPQGMFVMECAIAKAAEVLNIPREEIQRKNLLKEGDEFPYGQKAEAARAEVTWDKAVKTYDLSAIKQRIDKFNQTHFEVKKGYALMPICFGISFTATHLNQGSALVHVYTDGSVSITTGGVEMGQGFSTKVVELAVKTLGISPERIRVESTNTTRIANMSPSAASATTDLCGGATIRAIEQILSRLKRFTAEQLSLEKPDEITIQNEQVLYQGKPTGWDWKELIQRAYMARVSLSAHDFWAPPGIYFDRTTEKGHPFNYHVYGTAIIEVTLDCLRGIYQIDSVHLVHDLGRPVNKLVDIGQIEGGLAQGLGWMTVEDLQFDEKGRLLSNALASYKLPEVYFTPEKIDITLLEKADNPRGPYGSKAVGEPPLMYGIGVYFALRYAMRAFAPDKDFPFQAPLTPERVLINLYGDTKSSSISVKPQSEEKEVQPVSGK